MGNHIESNVRVCAALKRPVKIKQLKVEGGGHVPQCPIAGDDNACCNMHKVTVADIYANYLLIFCLKNL